MKLLTTSNTKILKGAGKGYMTFGLHLAPSDLSGYNVCPDASEGCRAACLNTAGRGAFTTVQKARIEKTLFFFRDRLRFMEQLTKEIYAAISKANKAGATPCFRLNLTSDLPWERIRNQFGNSMMRQFPLVQFYDYTASAERMVDFVNHRDFPPNYHLTFSRKEKPNGALIVGLLRSGGNVACVWRGPFPETNYGAPVISGDDDDLRFLDPKGVFIALTAKGKAKKDTTGFVMEGGE